MARVHLFTPSSSNEKRRHSPENNIAEDAPVPSLVEEHENKTISVSSQPIEEQQQPNLDVDTSSPTTSHLFMTAPSSPEQQQHDTNELSTSSAALTAALLQNAHGSNDMVGAVAAALSVKTDTFNVNNNNTEDKSDNAQPQNSDTMETRKPEDALDQATVAATALQLLGLSHTENKEKQNESSDNQATDDSNNENMLLANYQGIPSHLEDIDLASEEMIQDYKRGTWTREEDELLLAGIKKYGYGRWKEIATSIPGRKGKQLKQRWDNTLASKYVDQEWIRNKIRTEEALQQQQQQASSSTIMNDDKTLKFLENTDWNDIAMKITEKAREGDQHAIEALLSQALLGTVASHAAAAAANTSQQTDTPTATASANNSTTASPIQTNNTAIHHDSNPSTPTTSTSNQTNETMNLNFSRSALDSNNPTPLNYADAAALALYASHLSQQATNNNGESSSNALNPYFLPFGNTNNDSNAVAAAAAAAVAAVAQQQQQNKDNDSNNESGSPKLANRSAASIGHKRRRSDPALAETQSAAMSIYASSTPITTTINNQTQTVYPCLFPNCGKTFARLYNLKSHSRTHTDDRPFVCQSCNAAFSRNHDLKRHSKIHGGAKPYKCEGCQKSFSRLDALKRHKSNQRNKGSCTQD